MSLKNWFLFIWGGFIISYLIYFRIIYVRVPRELYTEVHFLLLIFYLLIVCAFSLLFYKNLYKVIYKEEPISTNPLVQKVKESLSKITAVYAEGLKTVDSVIKEIYPLHFNEYTRLLHVFFIDRLLFHHGPYLDIIFNYIPRLSLAGAFFYDVVINNYMQTFFMLAPLALIPLIYSYCCYASYNVYLTGIGIKPQRLDYEKYDEAREKFFPIEERTYIMQKWRECYTRYYRAKERYETDYLWGLKPYNDLPEFETYRINLTSEFRALLPADLTEEELHQTRMDYYLHLNQDVFYPFFFHWNIKIFAESIYGPRVRTFVYLIYVISWVYLILFSELPYICYI